MKEDRIEFRTSHEERRQIETAASFLGMNTSTYLRMVALERSVEILRTSETLVLSDRDRDLFLQALENPPKLNKPLKKALTEYRRNNGKFR
jgi:uncharacterized protein (DUF1778 family)